MKKPFLIGVAGGISSGKSTVCHKITEELALLNNAHKKHVLVISLDSFYRPLNGDELARAERAEYNLDHPDSFDDELCYNTLTRIIANQKVEIPVYDKKTYRTTGQIIRIDADSIPDVVIIEGILIFFYPKIR